MNLLELNDITLHGCFEFVLMVLLCYKTSSGLYFDTNLNIVAPHFIKYLRVL